MTEENTKTIDLTPTWLGILPVILHSYKELGETDEARRMAQLADLANEALHWYNQADASGDDLESVLRAGEPSWVTKARAMKEETA